MFKKYWAILILLVVSAQSMATDKPVEMGPPRFTGRMVELSDEVLSFIPRGVADTQSIIRPEASRLGLLGLSLQYYDKCLEQLALKEQFIPQQIRFTEQQANSFIVLYYPDGKEKGRISINNLQNEIYLNNALDINVLRQITLYMVFHYFRLLLEVHYLNFGKQHIVGFLDMKEVDKQFVIYNIAQKISQDAFPTEEIGELAHKKIILDNLYADYRHTANHHMKIYFGILFGLSPLHFMELSKGDNNYLFTELDFLMPSLECNRLQILINSHYVCIAKELMSFIPRINVNELKILAPLPVINHRNEFVRRLHEARTISEQEAVSMLSNTPMTEQIQSFIPGRELIRQSVDFSHKQAEKMTKERLAPFEQQIRGLEEEQQKLITQIKKLEADSAKDSLENDEKTKRSARVSKKSASVDREQVEKLKKQLNSARKARDDFSAKLKTAQASLEEKEAFVARMQQTVKEMAEAHKTMMAEKVALAQKLAAHENSSKELAQKIKALDVLIDSHKMIIQQIDEEKATIEVLSLAVEEAEKDCQATGSMLDIIYDLQGEKEVPQEKSSGNKRYDMDDIHALAADLKMARDANDTLKFQNGIIEERSNFFKGELVKLQNNIMFLQGQLSHCYGQLVVTTQNLEAEKTLRLNAEAELKKIREQAVPPRAEGGAL